MKGIAIAKLFIEGYAEYLSRKVTDEVARTELLGSAYANIISIAGHYIVGNDPYTSAKDQVSYITHP